MNEFKYKNGREFLTNIVSISYLAIGVPLLPFGIFYLNWQQNPANAPQLLKSLDVSTIVGSIIAIGLSTYAMISFRKLLNNARTKPKIQDKLMAYGQAFKRKTLFLFLAASLDATLFILAPNIAFVILFIILIILFSLSHPNLIRISYELRLKNEIRKALIKNMEFSDPIFTDAIE